MKHTNSSKKENGSVLYIEKSSRLMYNIYECDGVCGLKFVKECVYDSNCYRKRSKKN